MTDLPQKVTVVPCQVCAHILREYPDTIPDWWQLKEYADADAG